MVWEGKRVCREGTLREDEMIWETAEEKVKVHRELEGL
jgi:hypothetical protein